MTQNASPVAASFEIKSAQLPLVALMLKTADWKLLAADFARRFGPEGETPDFFDHDAVVLDFSLLPPETKVTDLPSLRGLLREYKLLPVAVRGGNANVMRAAIASGLAEAPADAQRTRKTPTAPSPEPAVPEQVREVRVEVPVEVRVEVPGPAVTTMVIDKPLRSGQKVYARGGDLVVLAMVNQGAEIAADGNIHVYAPLRGKAMAGARGNTQARIFSLCLEPELVSIAGVYRTSETALPGNVGGKPAQVRLASEGGQDKLIFEPLKA